MFPNNGVIDGLIPRRYEPKAERNPIPSQIPEQPPPKAKPTRKSEPVQKRQKTTSQMTPATLPLP